MIRDEPHGAIFVENRAALTDQLNSEFGEADRILVVASDRARKSEAIPPKVLSGRSVWWFTDFTNNPSLSSACAAAALVSAFRPSVVVGLGGGSAIDVAKAARVLPPDIASALKMVRSGIPLRQVQSRGDTPRIVAIPTLSGSGAEVTQFATTFHNGRKISVDRTEVRPDTAVVDPGLAATAPHSATSAAALDAFCHAIESAWSRSATAASRGHSARALQHLSKFRWRSDGPYSHEDRCALAAGAISAGLAINLTRTTAAHGCSYLLTVRHGIPHGVACALNMMWVARTNSKASAMEPEAVAIVEESLGIAITELSEFFRVRLRSADWPTHLGDYGLSRSDLGIIAADACHQSRLLNNPVELTVADIMWGLGTIL